MIFIIHQFARIMQSIIVAFCSLSFSPSLWHTRCEVKLRRTPDLTFENHNNHNLYINVHFLMFVKWLCFRCFVAVKVLITFGGKEKCKKKRERECVYHNKRKENYLTALTDILYACMCVVFITMQYAISTNTVFQFGISIFAKR